jgi:hypothetical protein
MPTVSNSEAGIAIELSQQSWARFNASLDRFLSSVRVNRDKAVRKLAGGLLADMTKLSPVDDGRFRAGWHAGYRALGSRPPPIPKATVKAGVPLSEAFVLTSPRAISEGERAGFGELVREDGETRVRVRNGVRYGPYLEAGASRQAPRGIVRVTFGRYRQFIDDNLRRLPVEGAR